MTNPDILVVGAGHNGLVTAAYLAKAGKSVVVLERHGSPGGQLAGRPLFGPGAEEVGLHVSGQLRPDIERDLDLARHGLAGGGDNDSPYVSALPDGGVLRLGSDANDPATLESIRRLSAKDAARWPEFVAFMNTAAGFLDAAYRTPMPRLPKVDWRHEGLPLASLALKLRGLGSQDMFRVIRSLSMSAIEFTEEWFESEPLKAAIGALGIHGQTLGSMSAGTGYVLVHHWLNRGGLAHRSAAGSTQQVTDALVSALRANGGQLRTSAGVAQILVDYPRVTGVRLESGEEIRAQTVISAADPRHTLLDLVGAAELPPEFVWQTQSIKMRGSVAKVHARTDGSHGLPPQGTVVVAPTLKYLERAYDASKYGEVSQQPYLEVTTAGKIVSIHFQFAPYKLRQGDWGTRRAALERIAIDTLSASYPAFGRSVQQTATLTPLDIEQGWGLTEGDLNHGQLILDQLFFMRPLPGWSNHRTPVDGLFLCGSGVHGGGGISGAAGRNAARQILRTLRG
jgi:phytoene dehydrogenase-like protein